MALSGAGFDLADFLGAISDAVRPGTARPVVVHAAELETLPAGAGAQPDARWRSPGGCRPSRSSSSGRRSRPARARTCSGTTTRRCTTSSPATGTARSRTRPSRWAAGDFIYTPPWTWHRHYNDSADEPVEFLTIENSRLLQALGIARRQSAGLCTRRRGARPIPEDESEHRGPRMSDLPEHISIWGELADIDHELRHVDVRRRAHPGAAAGSGPDLVLLHGTGGHLEAYARDIAGPGRRLPGHRLRHGRATAGRTCRTGRTRSTCSPTT